LTRFFDFAQNGGDVTPLEERISYKFRNSLLLAEALTHPSLRHEMPGQGFDNQRLEFLGDAVLQLVITIHLYNRFPEAAEGILTKFRARLVSKDRVKLYSASLGLGGCLLMGRGEEANGGRERLSSLVDAFEALVAAIYLDGGWKAAERFILDVTREDLDKIEEDSHFDENPKGRLQEILQSISPAPPVYEVVAEKGPEHERIFEVQALWQGVVIGHGSGRHKQQAEFEAARDALRLKLWTKNTTADPSKRSL
jgi:ribonuclease-3